MRVYIAGPMTGKEFYNVVAFEKAAAFWTELGHDAVTPFESNSIAWRRHFGRDFDPRVDVCDYGHRILPDMIAEDLKTLCSADAIAVLPGWEKSRGSKAEMLLAQNLDKPLYDAETGLSLGVKLRVEIDRG